MKQNCQGVFNILKTNILSCVCGVTRFFFLLRKCVQIKYRKKLKQGSATYVMEIVRLDKVITGRELWINGNRIVFQKKTKKQRSLFGKQDSNNNCIFNMSKLCNVTCVAVKSIEKVGTT